MQFNTFAASALLIGSAIAVAQPAPYKLGVISTNPLLGLMRRQDAGYAPTQHQCSSGDTCAEACGATQIQCASTDDLLHCYDPAIGQHCCTDGNGNACAEGYFCTSDSTGGTWCCPNGMDLTSCAAAYSLTDELVSQVSTSAPTASPTSYEATASTDDPLPTNTSITAVTDTFTVTSCTGSCHATFTPTSNSTLSPTVSAPVIEFTGGANGQDLYGLPAIVVGAAAVMFAL